MQYYLSVSYLVWEWPGLCKVLDHDTEISSKRKWERSCLVLKHKPMLNLTRGINLHKSHLKMITQHLKLVFALYHSSSSSSLQVYPAPKKLCPDSLLSGEKGTPASLLIPSSSSHCLHCRQFAWIWSDCMSRTSKFWSALSLCVCVSGHRLCMSVFCSTTWLRRMRTTRTLFAGATVAEAGARSAWVYISQHALWHFNAQFHSKLGARYSFM